MLGVLLKSGSPVQETINAKNPNMYKIFLIVLKKYFNDITFYPSCLLLYYSAIYRIEYENFTNKEARNNVRTLIKFSSFDDGKPKGEYLMHYKSRKYSLK